MEPLPGQAKTIQKLLYSPKESAQLLSLSLSTVRMLLARGMLSSRRIGSKRLIPHGVLVAFAQKNLPALWPPKCDGKTVRRTIAAKQMSLPFEKSPSEKSKALPAEPPEEEAMADSRAPASACDSFARASARAVGA